MIRVHRTIELNLAVEDAEEADDLVAGAVNLLTYTSEDDDRVLDIKVADD